MHDVEEKARKLEEMLKERNAPVLNYLNPGLQEKEIVDFFTTRSIKLHPDVMPLYKWRNGIDFPPDGIYTELVEIIPGGVFYSLSEMAICLEDMTSMDFLPDPADDYLPLFGSGESELFLLKISSGAIFFMSPHAMNFGELAFKSLEVMLDFILECYSKNILTIDPETGLKRKRDEYIAMLEKYEQL